MFELLVRLECAREALRRRILKSPARYGNSYFGIAILVLAATMLPGPLELITVPFVGIPIALVLFIVGLIFAVTIIALPYGLALW